MLIGLTKPMSASPLPAANNIELSLRKKKPYPQPLHITTVSYPHPLTINLARPNRSISPPVTGNTTKPSINYSSTNVTFTECWGALSLSLSLSIYIYIYIYIYTVGTEVAQWLRCCATNPKVAGSIPAGVIGIFH